MKQLIFLVTLILCSCCVYAHEIRPVYLEINENTDHSLTITWKQPTMGDYSIPLHPSITAGWLHDSLAEIYYTEAYLLKRWHITSTHEPLDKQTIYIDGLEKTITDVLVQINLTGEHSFTYLVKPVQPYVQLNIAKPQPPPLWQFIQLGMWHIWFGFDHLLFVLGLLLLVEKRSRLFWTITAFTIAHSITLALATLQIVNVPSAFIESAIALSIVFLAVELMHHYQGKDGLTYKYPWFVSFLFGLLHGLGFASALSDVGLPQNNIPSALFLFNVGVELGQISFILLILSIVALVKHIKIALPIQANYIPVYIIGTLAMYWFIERIMVF